MWQRTEDGRRCGLLRLLRGPALSPLRHVRVRMCPAGQDALERLRA